VTSSTRPRPAWLPKPVLRGELVTLRPFVRADAVTMAALLADPELLKFTGSVDSTAAALAVAPTPDAKTIDWYASRSVQDDRLDLGIVDNASGQLVGETVLNEWDAERSSANFRILIGAAGRNRGLGTEATRLTVGYGFEQLGLSRITLGVFVFNPRAVRAYRKAGFVQERVNPGAFTFDGEPVDEIVMAISAQDWERHRGRPAVVG
jgi:RimJ/RimL family protein N-acetyltransferase